jgi:hypothetical protein
VLLRTAQTSAVEPPFTQDKIHHSQDLDPPSPVLRQCDVGVDQKRGVAIARIWEEGSPNDMRPEHWNSEKEKYHILKHAVQDSFFPGSQIKKLSCQLLTKKYEVACIGGLSFFEFRTQYKNWYSSELSPIDLWAIPIRIGVVNEKFSSKKKVSISIELIKIYFYHFYLSGS